MIRIHVSAVCRVRDGFTGKILEGSRLQCDLDGARCRPTAKPGGYLVLTDLPAGPHRLSLRCPGYQEEWVEFSAGRDTQELDVTMKPGRGYPLQRDMIRLTLTVTEGGAPAAGRILWLAEKHLLAVYECCRADDLFRAAAVIGRLAASPGELYRWPSSQEGPCWRLIVPVTLGQYPALRCALGEYARVRGGGASYAAYTREHGILLSNRAAECLRPQ